MLKQTGWNILMTCCIAALGSAQERLGISPSNFSSTNAIFLNPAASVDSRTYMQLNLAGANAFASNNLFYIPRSSALDWRRDREVSSLQVSDRRFVKYVYGNFSLDGPAFVISKGNFGAGAFVRARNVSNVRRLPHQLTSLMLGQDPVGINQGELEVTNGSVSSLTWLEYGLNFGMAVRRREKRVISIGGNLRYLSGFNAVFADISRMTGYLDDTRIVMEDFNARMRYNYFGARSGRGVAADFGIIYRQMLDDADHYRAHSVRSNCRYMPYKYKIGLALRDAGFIRFRQQTSAVEYEGSGTFFSTRSGVGELPAIVMDNPQDPRTDRFFARLPLTATGQFDYNFENGFYVSAIAVKNLLHHRTVGTMGSNLFAIAPRFETRNIEFALPLTFQRFVHPHLGFAVRVRSFVLGFDNIVPVFLRTRTHTLGVYFNLGISLFRNPACSKRSASVDACGPEERFRSPKGPGLRRWFFGRRKTHSK